MRIGIDFDNTLVDYDHVFRDAAKRQGLVDEAFDGSKRELRDNIRLLTDGELAWQRLQGYVYGAGIGGARMFDGSDAFLRRCRTQGVEVFVISHKTQYGHHDPMRVDLRCAALDWMAARGFFCNNGYGISAERIFFENSRPAKLARIGAVGCTHFIDDLEEVLRDPDFPARVSPILFAASGVLPAGALCSSWRQIAAVLFDAQ
jgi:hypothetical protein